MSASSSNASSASSPSAANVVKVTKETQPMAWTAAQQMVMKVYEEEWLTADSPAERDDIIKMVVKKVFPRTVPDGGSVVSINRVGGCIG